MSVNKGFCYSFWANKGANVYLDQRGKCAAEIYGQKFDESGPINRRAKWRLLNDSAVEQYRRFATRDTDRLSLRYFEHFVAQLYVAALKALEQQHPGLRIGQTILENRVYHGTVNGTSVVVKLLPVQIVNVDEYLTKIEDLSAVEAPVIYYGLLEFKFNNIPEEMVYSVSEYLPTEYSRLPKQKKIALFSQLDRLIAEIHKLGYSDFDLHGGNFLYSPANDMLYVIDIDDLNPNLDNADRDNFRLEEFKQLVLLGEDPA